MRVVLEKRYADSYKKIIREANKLIRSKSIKEFPFSKYEKILLKTDISAESKKKSLVENLHSILIRTFSIDSKKIGKKSFENFKKNSTLIRQIINKIKSINSYLEESLLKEIGIAKKSALLSALKTNKPRGFLEKTRGLSKDYIANIEHTVYTLMQNIVFFDEKLLKKYSKKEVKIIETESFEVNDIEKTLSIETELLDALEAKIPPSNKISPRLFKKSIFNQWAPLIFALLASFEAEYQKERQIFSKLKGNSRLKRKFEKRIKHVIIEKEKMLKIKEERALSMKSLGKISNDHRQVLHEYISAAGL